MSQITVNTFSVIRLITISLLLIPSLLHAHNNPEFENKLIISVDVNESTQLSSEKFTITYPKETIRLVWDVKSEDKSKIRFSLKQGDEIIAKNLKDGMEVMPSIFNDESIVITDVTGADSSFKIDVLARVIVEKKKTESALTSAGKKVYKQANCVGCHKWHGDGGGGYGGAALSLRTTVLNAELIKLVVRCGRPSSGMPFHGRSVYKGDDVSCYETTGEEFGEDKPPRARKLLSERQLDAVVDYVVNVIKGSGEPSLEQCTAYWGEKSRQCDSLRE